MIRLRDLLKEVRIVKEGGNAFDNVVGIKQDEVLSTVKAVFNKVLKPCGLIGLDEDAFLLGSAGKKAPTELSGDLDIAVSADQIAAKNTIKISEVLDWLDKKFQELGYQTQLARGFGQVSIPFPIVGRKPTEYVQIDILVSTNLDWSRFVHTSPNFAKGESKYKNSYRNLLLNNCVSAYHYVVLKKTDDDIPLEVEKYVLRLDSGVYSIRKSFEGKKAGTILKSGKVLKEFDKLITNTPEEFVHLFFGEKYSVEDISSFEKLYDLVFHQETNLTPHRDRIMKNFLHGIETTGFPMPEIVDVPVSV